MKVAVLSLGWPPLWGGGEVYPHRLVEALCSVGVDAWGITATPELEGMDNGSAPTLRITPPEVTNHVESHNYIEEGDYNYKIIPMMFSLPNKDELVGSWLREIEQQVDCESFDLVIHLNQTLPLREGELHTEKIKRMFPNRITLSYDIDKVILLDLEMQVRDTHRNYDEVLQMFNAMLDETNEEGLTLAEELKEHNKFLHTHSEPEEKARLYITEFNKKVVNNLLHKEKGFVFHPPLDESWWLSEKKQSNDVFTIGAINPIGIKGGDMIVDAVVNNPDYHFRVLAGGWGNGKRAFTDRLAHKSNFYGIDHPTNYELIDYVDDIKGFYDSLDVFMFPSQTEGYGQVASEAMSRLVPVVTKDYPTIREASHNHAYYVDVKDYAIFGKWSEALREVEEDYDYWLERTENGAKLLKERQNQECLDLKLFLEQISAEVSTA